MYLDNKNYAAKVETSGQLLLVLELILSKFSRGFFYFRFSLTQMERKDRHVLIR